MGQLWMYRRRLAAEPGVEGASDSGQHHSRLHLRRAIGGLTERLGHAPNVSELATELGLNRDEALDYLMHCHDSRADQTIEDVERSTPAFLDELERQLIEHSSGPALCAGIGALSDEERAVFVMRFGGSLSYGDIATKIGESPTRVVIVLTRALVKLRDWPRG